MIKKSFVTGSHAYGTPSAISDIDLVVLVSKKDLRRLIDSAECKLQVDGQYYDEAGGVSLRFGTLNLLCVTDEKVYEVWRRGTSDLKKKKPVARDYAVRYFARLRQKSFLKRKD